MTFLAEDNTSRGRGRKYIRNREPTGKDQSRSSGQDHHVHEAVPDAENAVWITNEPWPEHEKRYIGSTGSPRIPGVYLLRLRSLENSLPSPARRSSLWLPVPTPIARQVGHEKKDLARRARGCARPSGSNCLNGEDRPRLRKH